MSPVQSLMPQFLMAPILLPMATAAVMLLLGNHRRIKAALGVVSCTLGTLIAIALVAAAKGPQGTQAISVYLEANWAAPFGIVLVLDRLSALMLLLTSVLGLSSILYALARWDRAGVQFHPLFQLQLMGLSGAFLTGDIFNLFVFFEIMLAASYGLLLHGSGWGRVRAGLHYLAINLVASALLLIGIAMLYGVTGTLNMADLARLVPTLAGSNRGLFQAGAAILAVAFLIKAGAWPLGFWLAPAYASAPPPSAALFAILTKLGAYAVLRVWTLFFSLDAGTSAAFGGTMLIALGMGTIAFGSIGVIATHHLGRMTAFCAVVSSGTWLAAMGFGRPAITGGAIYYILGSTLAISALFLLTELIERARDMDERLTLVADYKSGDSFWLLRGLEEEREVNLDDNERALIGLPIPAALAFLGLAFMVCGLTIAGMPPFSGFIGKVVMLSAVLNPAPVNGLVNVDMAGWLLLALLMVSGLLIIIAFSRAGARTIWAPIGRALPRLRVIETLPIAALLVLVALLVWQADPILRYVNATAQALHQPQEYIHAVLDAQPVPPPAVGGAH